MKPYYDDGKGIVIYHARCEDVLPLLAPSSCDLVLTDPPYERQAHAKMRRTRSTIEGRAASAAMPFMQIDEDLRALFVTEAMRVSQGWAIWFCQAEAIGRYADLCGDAWRRAMIWVKPDSAPQFTGDRPAMGYEPICAAWAGTGVSRWHGGGMRGVLTYPCTDFVHEHPAQKPIPLMKRLIVLFSDSNAMILDPFMGSGTTLRAAKDTGRSATGIEQDERWCEIAARRLEQSVLDLGGVA